MLSIGDFSSCNVVICNYVCYEEAGRSVILDFSHTSNYRLAIFLVMMFEFSRELAARINTQLGILIQTYTSIMDSWSVL